MLQIYISLFRKNAYCMRNIHPCLDAVFQWILFFVKTILRFMVLALYLSVE